MPTDELVLTHFPDMVYAAKAGAVFAALGIGSRAVAPGETGQTVGFLAGLPGQSARAKGLIAPKLTDPMLVLCGLSRERMDTLFAALRAAGAPPPNRKAILTPTNMGWTLDALYEELGREHEAMHDQRR